MCEEKTASRHDVIFLLMVDSECSPKSKIRPTGFAVLTKEEADGWVINSKTYERRAYEEIILI